MTDNLAAPRAQRGAVLAVALMLLAIVTLVGAAAARQVSSELRLTGSLRNADRAFALAAGGIETALEYARDYPATLPASGALHLPPQRTAVGSVRREIRHSGDGNCSAPFSGRRSDYEIRATAETARAARSHQRLTFSICRETCDAELCAESPPQVYSWFETRPDY